jgi:hypothetical protein
VRGKAGREKERERKKEMRRGPRRDKGDGEGIANKVHGETLGKGALRHAA